jgi:hypothetical protein
MNHWQQTLEKDWAQRMTERYYILVNHEAQPEPDLLKWADWFNKPANRKVAKTQIGSRLVSTIFLGIDHRFLGNGPPLLFETMIFGPDRSDDYQERCSTWQEAEEQHARAIEELKRMQRNAQ